MRLRFRRSVHQSSTEISRVLIAFHKSNLKCPELLNKSSFADNLVIAAFPETFAINILIGKPFGARALQRYDQPKADFINVEDWAHLIHRPGQSKLKLPSEAGLDDKVDAGFELHKEGVE